jgi:nicotinamidase-related amidase
VDDAEIPGGFVMKQVQLLLIDPQNDFCDQEGAALPVAGALADLKRVAALIDRWGERLSAIHVTLDSHQPLDIAHPAWWRNADGATPPPYTPISIEDVENGVWRSADPAQQTASLAYVRALEAAGRYQLIVWPEHCLLGGWGHNVQPELFDALKRWGRTHRRSVNYVVKGLNPATEHYSALRAEVPDPADPATLPDRSWLGQLSRADTLLVAGEALSHCVAGTVRDLADLLGRADSIVLLTDCTSPVPGFEAAGQAFVDEMHARGMRRVTSAELSL